MKKHRLLLLASMVASSLVAQTGVLQVINLVKDDKLRDISVAGMNMALYAGDSVLAVKYDQIEMLEYYDALEPGRYRLVYATVFKQPDTLYIVHDGRAVKPLKLYRDAWHDDPGQYTLTEHLQPGDTLSFEFYGYGCEPFDGGTLWLTSQKEGGSIHFKQDYDNLHFDLHRSLKPAHLSKVALFERQLRNLDTRFNGSTNTFCYQIRLNGEAKLHLKSVAWDWMGMARIRRLIFGK